MPLSRGRRVDNTLVALHFFVHLFETGQMRRQGIALTIATTVVACSFSPLGRFPLPGCDAWLTTTTPTAPAGATHYEWVSSKRCSLPHHVSTGSNVNKAVGIDVTQQQRPQNRACYQAFSTTTAGQPTDIPRSSTSGLLYGRSWARGRANSDTSSRLWMAIDSDG